MNLFVVEYYVSFILFFIVFFFSSRRRHTRFDCDWSSDVCSSDLAQGADILVHDALYAPGVDRLVAGVPNATTLKQSIMSHHTTAEDAGRVAQTAGVKTLVLSHFVPPEDPDRKSVV